jgi:hypothetical protein
MPRPLDPANHDLTWYARGLRMLNAVEVAAQPNDKALCQLGKQAKSKTFRDTSLCVAFRK